MAAVLRRQPTVEVYSPSASKLGSIAVAASTSNVAFGGSEGKTLYITASKALCSLEMNLPGYYCSCGLAVVGWALPGVRPIRCL